MKGGCVCLSETFGEIESEGWLIGSKVVYVEDEFFGQVLFVPPNNPPNSGIHEAILVATHINALH